MKASIAIYGSHDASISIRIGANEYRTYELERITGKRYYSLNKDIDYKKVLIGMYAFLKEEHGITSYDSIFYAEINPPVLRYIKELFAPVHMELIGHHLGHAATALWQSPFQKSLIISFDGGGQDKDGVTYFNIFTGDKKTNKFDLLGTLPLDICSAYTLIAFPLEVIKKDSYDSYLAWAGKIMGLVAYGKVREEWKTHFLNFYYGHINHASLIKLFVKIGAGSANMNYVTDFQMQADIAATSQSVFEEVFISAVRPYINRTDLPLCITGGGALNVLLNQLLHNTLERQIFIPCNPSDCGLSLGFMLLRYQPEGEMKNVVYSGFPLADGENFEKYISDNSIKKILAAPEDLAQDLVNGKVIGLVQGNSEVGPRALGNRSILAYPDSLEIKDKINNRIKFREPFRPLSPVCRWEDANKYFSEPCDSAYMSYSQLVFHHLKHEREDQVDTFTVKDILDLPAIVHADGSARLQTVKKNENELLHEILSEVNALTGYGILINTSFNSKGKPILTTRLEALQVLVETELDGVYMDGFLYYL